MKPHRRAWGIVLCLLSLWLSPLLALAQDATAGAAPPAPATSTASPATSTASPAASTASPADLERAKASFNAGAAAYAAGEYLAAIQALQSAYALTPLPAIAFSLAQAERRQYFASRKSEHLAAAISLFHRYIQQVPSGGRRTDAIDALSQLEPLAAKLATPLTPPTTPEKSPLQDTRLMVTSEAPGARIWIDGVELSASPLIREVAPGKHRVRVTAKGFRPREREVIAVQGELIPVSMPLDALPSTLEVTTPADAEIYVDGAYVSPGGDRVVLELPGGSHRVSVAANGHEVSSQLVVLERGGWQRATFALEPSTQRITARVLLIGSGASLAAGVAFGALAVASENAAQDFIARKELGNVTEAELVRYDADVTLRDRYRWMAGASFGASLGLLLTGLFLHELDQPGPEELNRGGLGVSAVVTPGHVGASWQVEF